MSYCSRDEVRALLKLDAVSQIITDNDGVEDPEEREAILAPLIDEAIADADARLTLSRQAVRRPSRPGSQGHQQVFQGYRPL